MSRNSSDAGIFRELKRAGRVLEGHRCEACHFQEISLELKKHSCLDQGKTSSKCFMHDSWKPYSPVMGLALMNQSMITTPTNNRSLFFDS